MTQLDMTASAPPLGKGNDSTFPGESSTFSRPALFNTQLGALKHLRREVHAQHPAIRADPPASEDEVYSTPAAQVGNRFPLLEPCKRGRVPAATGEGKGKGRDRGQLLLGVKPLVRCVARTGLWLKASRCRLMCQHCHSKAAVPFADQLLDLVAFHESRPSW